MKKILLNILIVSLLTAGFVAIPKPAYAACNIGGVVAGNGLTDCVNELLVITVMPIVGKLLQITAYLFDKALLLNLNIASFVQVGNGTTISPVEIIWRIIRDLSGMFFIFLLLMASIKMILGLESSKGIIVGIIIAGLFVNFSLFVTKVAIDASNAFTLTIYNAIAPNQATSLSQALWWGETVSSNDPNGQVPGGISSIIMEVVDIQTLFASTKTATQQTNFNVNSIVIITGGVALMLFLGIAYLAAGVMLLWRFIYLLALMAFSPIWALSYAFPQLSDKRAQFTKELIGQCLFAPIFLFTLYIALKIFTNPDFLKLTNPANSTFANVFAGSGIAPLVQYGLVLFVIYSGLGLASAYGGKGGEFGVKWMENITKWGQGAVKNAGQNTLRFAGRNTYGRAASALADSDFIKDRAGKGFAGKMVLTNLKGVAKNYDENIEKKKKDKIAFAESLGYNKGRVFALDLEIKSKKDAIAKNDADLLILEQRERAAPDAAAKAAIASAIKANKDRKKAIQKEIKQAEQFITEEKNRRKGEYADEMDPRGLDPKTGEPAKLSIWNRVKKGGYVGSDEEQASASINATILEDDIKKAKEKLEDKKKDRDKAKEEVTRLTKEKKERGDAWWSANPGKQVALDEAHKKFEDTVRDEVMPLEQEIRDMEFEVKKFKNLS